MSCTKSGVIFSIVNPMAGTWSVTINDFDATYPSGLSLDTYSVSVSGESDLNLDSFRFVEIGDRPGHEGFFPIIGLPLAGHTTRASAEVFSENISTIQFELRAKDGRVLQTLNLEEIQTDVGISREFFGEVNLPDAPFLVYAVGLTNNGAAYQRVVPAVIRPQTVRITAPPIEELRAGQTTAYTLQVQNLGASETFNFSGTDEEGFIRNIEPSAFTLGTNETANVTVELEPPFDVRPGTLNRLTFSAQGGNSSTNFAIVRAMVALAENPPTVNIESPTDNDSFNEGTTVTVNANADDSNGTVSKVEFFLNARLVGTTRGQPHTITLRDLAAGRYALEAVATDNSGERGYSAPVRFRVKSPPRIELGTTTATETSGDGDDYVEPGEEGSLTVQLVNHGGQDATNVRATLTAITPGASIVVNESAYPHTTSASAQANYTSFTFRLAANAPRGLAVGFSLRVLYDGIETPKILNFWVPTTQGPRRILYTSNSEVYAINPDGGEQANLSGSPPQNAEAVWSPDGTRIAFTRNDGGISEIHIMAADGSNLTRLTNGTSDCSYPAWSPDGTKIAFWRDSQILVMNADGGNLRQLADAMSEPHEVAWSPDGTRIGFIKPGNYDDIHYRYNYDLATVNVDGSNQTSLTNEFPVRDLAWSPDGTMIAFIADAESNWDFEGYNEELYVMNVDGGNVRRLTHSTRSSNPSWSPDSARIAFASYRARTANKEIYVVNSDGSQEARLTHDQRPTFHPAFPPNDDEPVWSPDGSRIAYTRDASNGGVYIMNPDGSNQIRLAAPRTRAFNPRWQPPIRPPSTIDGAPPTTTASLSTIANDAGWHNRDVTVTLSASDGTSGSGVREITCGATGAQTVSSTIVSGASVTLVIAAEGETVVTFFARDNAGSAEAMQTLAIRIDKTAPTVSALAATPSGSYIPGGWTREDVTVSFAGTDALSGIASVSAPVVVGSEGANQFAVGICTDRAGNEARIVLSGINIDKTPPTITNARTNIAELWPPNHRMVEVRVDYDVTDALDSTARSSLTVTSNESVDGTGDGNTSPDWEIIDAHRVRLRAETSGSGNGRIYTMTIMSVDTSGNMSTQNVIVLVPKSRGR